MFNNTLIRCSSLGAIMTDPRSKSETLSETCKQALVEIYIDEAFGRKKFVILKTIQKGLQAEEDSITLLSRIHRKMYVKNEEKFKNDFIKGTPDIIDGKTIRDTKTSWDIFTFFKNSPKMGVLDKNYFWQVQGYMWLTGAEKAFVDFCLVNTPQSLIEQEKFKEERKLGFTQDVALIDRLHNEIEKMSKYDDIPIDMRVLTHEVERDEEAIHRIADRVELCREWLCSQFQNQEDVISAGRG